MSGHPQQQVEKHHLACLQVLVDGFDVRDSNLHELRGQVGLVSQEPILFSCTVRDNICYANPEATQQQVEEAAMAANAHSFVERLPDGYNTQVSCGTDTPLQNFCSRSSCVDLHNTPVN